MKNILQQAESLLGRFKPIDVDCVYSLSHSLGHNETLVKLEKNNQYVSLHQIYTGTAFSIPANRIKVSFYGGPIGYGKWFDGTLYSFILNCIATKIQMEGFEVTRRLLRCGKI
jgi:hypothetical protein